MAKEEQTIMVVNRDKLFGENRKDLFNGFSDYNGIDYESRIVYNYEWMRRGKSDDDIISLESQGKKSAESDPRFKQPIAYCMIVNKRLNKVFAYQRSSGHNEDRLGGKISWGIGGHIEKLDVDNIDGTNPIQISMNRELTEEVDGLGEYKFKVLGYINDETNSVGQVHIGVLYIIETDSENIIPRDSEIEHGEFRSISELEKICEDTNFEVESWSRIAFEPLKKLLS
jgi:predicted NUDIX family phosphoesterase